MKKFLKLPAILSISFLAAGALAAGKEALPGDAGFAVYNYTNDYYTVYYTFDYDTTPYHQGLGAPYYSNTLPLPITSPNNYINLTQIVDANPSSPYYGKIVEQGGWFSQGSYAIYPPQTKGGPIRFVKIK